METLTTKHYDLEDRTFHFTENVIKLINNLPSSVTNNEIGKQLVRSAGSVGANYIEANESISKKDFAFRIKICRKESKESRYWLGLISINMDLEQQRSKLIQESTELMKIFGAILEKTKTRD
ncbi:MAG: four helix bundle protein [Bacteroidetes bacterium]|nr:four helix bundle protein [Bacteroidota bacterium]